MHGAVETAALGAEDPGPSLIFVPSTRGHGTRRRLLLQRPTALPQSLGRRRRNASKVEASQVWLSSSSGLGSPCAGLIRAGREMGRKGKLIRRRNSLIAPRRLVEVLPFAKNRQDETDERLD